MQSTLSWGRKCKATLPSLACIHAHISISWNQRRLWLSTRFCDKKIIFFPRLTFFTLWGFFSLRHLRMSISVVFTQPGCGRRKRTECVRASVCVFLGQTAAFPHHVCCSALVLLSHHNNTVSDFLSLWFLSRWAACGVAPATLRLKTVYAALSSEASSSDYDSFSYPTSHACVPDSPLVDGRPRTPSPGCLGSSSRLCPSSCRSCREKGNEPLIRTEISTQTQQISIVQFLPSRPVWSPHRATGEPAAYVSYILK